MVDLRRISAQHYYDVLPSPTHRCGDIWSGINTMGLIGAAPVSGIVVTPACDLAQRKSETVTFLPIISLRCYFSTLGALPAVRRSVESSLRAGGFDPGIFWGEYSFRPPAPDIIAGAIQAINIYAGTKRPNTKQIDALERAISGLRIINHIAEQNLTAIPSQLLASAFKDWEDVKGKLIRNSYNTNLHFLPSDEQARAFSGMPSHSLVMFRYPITVPMEVLDLASGATESTWQGVAAVNIGAVPFLEHYRTKMPMKTLSVRSEFLSDLLSRYVAVYNRIGSPDFTPASVVRMCSEVDQ